MFTLDEVVREYLIERGDASMNTYARTLQLGISGLRSMHNDVSGTPSVAFIEVTSLGTAPLPLDYVNYIRIGVIDATGSVISLGLNDSMAAPVTTNDCGDPQRIRTNIPASVSDLGFEQALIGWNDNYRNGEFMGRMFGIGGGNNIHGYYKVFDKNGYILLQCVGASHIYLEYLADPAKASGKFLVHPFDVEPLKMYMYWKGLLFNQKIGRGEKDAARMDYFNAKRHAKTQHNPVRVDEWLQEMRRFNQLTPKT